MGIRFAMAFVVALASVTALRADVIVKKTGEILEAKITGQTMESYNGKQAIHYTGTREDGSTVKIPDPEVAYMIRQKCSWEVKAEEVKWYEGQKKSRIKKGTWREHYEFTKDIKYKKYLEDQLVLHQKEAYKLKKVEVDAEQAKIEKLPDKIDARLKFAKFTERELHLLDEALDEFHSVYELKLKDLEASDKDSPDMRQKLGKWCEENELYDEALAEYNKVLEAKPNDSTAKKSIERVELINAVVSNAQMYRTIRDYLYKTAAYIGAKQNPDGSFGGDIVEAGVQGQRAITAMCAQALISEYEFRRFEKAGSEQAPDKVAKALEFMLKADVNKKALQGEDIWGNAACLDFLLKCYSMREFRARQGDIKNKVDEVIKGLAKQQDQDGGWSYYEFSKSTSMTFLTSWVAFGLMSAKEEKLMNDDAMIQRAVGFIEKCKISQGVFQYRTGTPQEKVGSSARGAVCEAVLLAAGKGKEEDVKWAVENFIAQRPLLEKIKGKVGTHIGEGQTAPYYFLYGHFVTIRAAKMLSDKKARENYSKQILDGLVPKHQENNGSFTDAPLTQQHEIMGSALGALTIYHGVTMENYGLFKNYRKR